jgi:hypothetical protein
MSTVVVFFATVGTRNTFAAAATQNIFLPVFAGKKMLFRVKTASLHEVLTLLW